MTKLKFEPRPYQRIAAKFLLENKRANLWAKPGMGKTGTVLTALDILKLASSSFFPAIVLAPLRVAQVVWPGEQRKWIDFEGMKVATILGTAQEREEALLRTGCDVFVVNYDNIQWLVERLGRKWPFRIVCADESTKIKNFRGWLDPDGNFKTNGKGGKRSAALASIAQNTGRWMNLTGTPATNGLSDLWGQQWFVDYGKRLGRTYGDYKRRFFMTDEYTGALSAQMGAEPVIHQLLADCTMALRPEDWLPIEQPINTKIEVEMAPAVAKMYRKMEREYFIELGNPGQLTQVEATNALAKSAKLLQLAVGAVYDAEKHVHHVHDGKLDALEDVIEECGGEPVLVAFHFRFDVARIKQRFPDAREIKTEQDVADWNAGKIQLGLGHPASLGHGQNLQDGGRIVVFYSHTWDLELRLQFIERVGPTRQAQSGYKRSVLIYDLVTLGTIEREVLMRHELKLSIQEALMMARAQRNADVDVENALRDTDMRKALGAAVGLM
jgi:SNF2 family DNA or RNA helicase